jgi:hypothetical protein
VDTNASKSKNLKLVYTVLICVQCAVHYGDTKVIAELLDSGVDVDAVTDHSDMSNALMYSSMRKDLDTVRFLFQRGASVDILNVSGCRAIQLCWLGNNDLTRHSSMDVFNVFVESDLFDIHENPYESSVMLCLATWSAFGAEIDVFVRLGVDPHRHGLYKPAAIHFAAWFGNYSAYSALASYYDEQLFKNDVKFASIMLLATMFGRLHRPEKPSSTPYTYLKRPSEHDEIMIDILQRGVGPRTRLQVAYSVFDWRPPGIHDQEIEADKLAAALGPETEAWYLCVLRRCGFLVHGDYQRLRELAEAGHVAAGFVYDIAEGSDEVNDSNAGGENIYTDIDGVSRRSSISEADEANQFWDAEEVL